MHVTLESLVQYATLVTVATTLTGLVLATATLLGTSAAFAGPINVGSGGNIITTETSWESNTSTPGQILQGVVSVGTISNSIAAVNPVYVTGGGGQFLSAVFNGFTLQTVNLTGNAFQLFYSGGTISYYTSPTNPFASNTEVNSGTIASSEANVTSARFGKSSKLTRLRLKRLARMTTVQVPTRLSTTAISPWKSAVSYKGVLVTSWLLVLRRST